MTRSTAEGGGLREQLAAGPVICAEGYLFELEQRGYLQAGAFVPEVVLDHPEQVTLLHQQFVHSGSDVVEAFTYYGHREKLRLIGKEEMLEDLNRTALSLARDVAHATGTLFAGNICNTNVWEPGDRKSHHRVRKMFEEQVEWAVDAGADLVIGETFSYADEALEALDVITSAELPSVMTLAIHRAGTTREGWTVVDACSRLSEAGADVVGLNCIRGPETMLPLLEGIAPRVSAYVAALPVPYRTHAAEPTFQSLRDPTGGHLPGQTPFPTALDPFTCSRYEIAGFTKKAQQLGVSYFGVCCGAAPHHIRSMAEALGRTPEASRYSPDMSKHAFLGTDASLREHNVAFRNSL
ncbi:MAG: homocysteine S-methyltransferase family protein [Actinomycetota bacterium]